MTGERRARAATRPLHALEITGCDEHRDDPERHFVRRFGVERAAPPRHEKGRLVLFADPQTGVAPEAWTPRPPYAFKISMFNVFCNSH